MIAFGGFARASRVAPGPGVELDDRRSELGAGFQRLRRRFDEHRDPDSFPRELGDEGLQGLEAADHIKPAFGGSFRSLFRHEATGVRADLKRNVEHGLGRGHLEIERLRDRRLEADHVVVENASAVLPQVRGDAVAPIFDRKQRARTGSGTAAARVATVAT